MYSISTVIVGIPITEQLTKHINDQGYECPSDELENLGFELLYHGGGASYYGYCGVKLGEFDECSEFIQVHVGGESNHLDYQGHEPHKVPLEPTEKQWLEASAKIAKLPEEIRQLCPNVGTYIVSSTS